MHYVSAQMRCRAPTPQGITSALRKPGAGGPGACSLPAQAAASPSKRDNSDLVWLGNKEEQELQLMKGQSSSWFFIEEVIHPK